jgi:hypothetical protein
LSRSGRGGKQLGKRDGLVGAVGQSEVRYALAYLWSGGGARHVPDVNEEPYGAVANGVKRVLTRCGPTTPVESPPRLQRELAVSSGAEAK